MTEQIENIPESILSHVRKCAQRQDVLSLRTVVTNEIYDIGLSFTLMAIVEGRGIVKPSNVRHRPDGASFLVRFARNNLPLSGDPVNRINRHNGQPGLLASGLRCRKSHG